VITPLFSAFVPSLALILILLGTFAGARFLIDLPSVFTTIWKIPSP
jgi:hypothetical protein